MVGEVGEIGRRSTQGYRNSRATDTNGISDAGFSHSFPPWIHIFRKGLTREGEVKNYKLINKNMYNDDSSPRSREEVVEINKIIINIWNQTFL